MSGLHTGEIRFMGVACSVSKWDDERVYDGFGTLGLTGRKLYHG